MEQKKVRNSNLELLRIFCIIAIISGHFIGQSGIEGGGVPSAFFCAMNSLTRVACSVFIIISAWFLVDMPFRFKRVLHVWLTVVMFTIPCTLYCMQIGIATKFDLYSAFLPIERSPLWFAGYYIVLILLSPLLNLLMNDAYKQKLEWIVFVLFCLIVLYPTITADLNFLSNDLWILIFLYLATGYIKKYRCIPGCKASFLVFGITWLLLTSLRTYLNELGTSDLYIVALLKTYCDLYWVSLQTLPNLILAYSAFFGFYGLKIKPSKLINVTASASLGVYCFHQVPIWYGYLWTDWFRAPIHAELLRGAARIFYIILSITIVWATGTVLEFIRSKISHILIEDREYCNFWCTRVDNMVNSFGSADYHLYKKIILVVVIFLAAVKFMSIEHYWHIPLNTNQNLVGENLKLNISGDLDYINGNIIGMATITNEGPSIQNLSNGTYPVNLGISIVDPAGNIAYLDFLHQPIMMSGILKTGKSVNVAVNIENMSAYVNSGYGIRLEIVQENISWLDDTAQYYWFEPQQGP